jgi:hypothetical protein
MEARNKPSLDWVKNITSKQLSDNSVDELNQKTTHFFSVLWMLIRCRLSDSLSDDLDEVKPKRLNRVKGQCHETISKLSLEEPKPFTLCLSLPQTHQAFNAIPLGRKPGSHHFWIVSNGTHCQPTLCTLHPL